MQALTVQGHIKANHVEDETGWRAVERCQAKVARLVECGQIRNSRPVDPLRDEDHLFPTPNGWSWARLGTIADIVSGVTKGRKLAGRKTVELPYLRVANVQRGRLDLEKMKSIEIPVQEEDRYQLQFGDLLLTEGGDWDKLGRTAIWRGDIPRCIHQNHVFRARLGDNSILPEWVMLFTNSLVGRAYFENAAKQTTNLASINMKQLRNCPVPVPPTATQRHIIEVVGQFSARISELSATLHEVDVVGDRLALTAIRSWCHRIS